MPVSSTSSIQAVFYHRLALSDEPVGYWRLGESVGTTAYDISGGEYHGTYVSGPTLRLAGLIDGPAKCVLFDGTADYVQLPDENEFNGYNYPAGWTIEAWFKATDVTGTRDIFTHGTGASVGNCGWILAVVNGVLNVYASEGALGPIKNVTGGAVSANVAYYAAATWDGSTLTLYLNGVASGTPVAMTGSVNWETIGPRIGCGATDVPTLAATDFFVGYIQEVAFYGTALSAADIAAHYAARSWAGFTGDVRSEVPITSEWGISGWTPHDRVADPGAITWALDNSNGNAAGTSGRYSPDHASCRADFALGLPIRHVITYSGTDYVKGVGTLTDIDASPGQYAGPWLTRCTAGDWFSEAAGAKVQGLELQSEQSGEKLIDLLVKTSALQPLATDFNTGEDAYALAFDDAREDGVDLLGEINRLTLSGYAHTYQLGDGTLTYEPRGMRAAKTSASSTLTAAMLKELDVSHSRDDVYSHIIVTVHPRRIDDSAVVLYRLSDLGVEFGLGPSESKSFVAYYTDPNDRNQRVGGTGMITPVATTDYLFNEAADGTGADRTTYLSVSVTFYATAAVVTVQNTLSGIAYITEFQIRGRGIYGQQVAVFRQSQESTAILYGKRTLNFDMPYQGDPSIGNGASLYLKANHAAPRTAGRTVTFWANQSAAVMAIALARDVGDRVAVTEAQTGLSARNYFIQRVKFETREANKVYVTWVLAPVSQVNGWILGVTGFGELGSATYLGF